MAKSESIDFVELFGASSVRESLNANVMELQQRQPAPLPMDDAIFDFLSPTSNKAAQQVLDDALVQEISGYEPAAAPIRPAPISTSTAMFDFTKRAARVLHEAPAHRRAIQTIVNKFRYSKALTSTRDDSAWDRLVQSSADFVTGAILAAGV